MQNIRVADVMTRLVVRLYPDDTVREAQQRLALNDISGAPVVQAGKAIGVISQKDLAKAELWVLVSQIMSRHVISISPEAPIPVAASMMDRHVVKRLVVVDESGYLIGIVSRGDVVRALAATARSEVGAAPSRT